jgi:hypothetical protein
VFVHPGWRVVTFADHYGQFAVFPGELLHKIATDAAASESGDENGAVRGSMFFDGGCFGYTEGFFQLGGEACYHFVHSLVLCGKTNL